MAAVSTQSQVNVLLVGPFAALSPKFRAEYKAAGQHNKNVQKDKVWKKQFDKAKLAAEVHNTAANEINSKLPGFNKDKRWKNADGTDIDLTKNAAKQKEYDDAAMREILNPAYSRAAVKVYGSKSPSERYTLEIQDASTGTLKVRDSLMERRERQLARLKHADDEEIDEPLEDIKFKILRTANGHIRGMEPADPEAKLEHDLFDVGEEFLEHYGVKGMKWGVRKKREGPGRLKRAGSAIKRGFKQYVAHLAESSWEASTYDRDSHETVHNEVASALDNRITRLQTSPKYRGKNLKADSDLRKEYYQDVAKVTESAYRRAVKDVYGDSPSGEKRAHYVTDVRGPRIEIRDASTRKKLSESKLKSMREIENERMAEAVDQMLDDVFRSSARHAATDEGTADAPDIVIPLKLDDNGQITGVTFVTPKKVEHGDLGEVMQLGEEHILEHYGVKGMRWGVRRDRGTPVAVTPTATSVVPHGDRRKTKIKADGGQNHDASDDAIKAAKARVKLAKSGPKALSNQELQELANRMRLEQQVNELTRNKGAKFLEGLFVNQGKSVANEFVRENVRPPKKKAAS